MSDQATDVYESGSKLEEHLIKAFMYPILAFILPFAPRYAIHSFQQINMVTIRSADNAEFLASNRRFSEDDAARVKALTERLDAFIEVDDWRALADELARVDTSREALKHDGARLSDIAYDYLQKALGETYVDPSSCFPDDYITVVPDAMLARIEDASRAHPDHPYLTALLAQCHIDRGWAARGGGWAHEVTDEGWEKLMNSFRTAHNLLQRFDLSEVRSPFYARVLFQLLATEADDNALDHAREAYQNWSDLDTGNPLPHANFAFFALPRWFGTWPLFEEEAKRAAERTRHTLGQGAYALFYLKAFAHDDWDALECLDVDTFAAALDDLVRHDQNSAQCALAAAVTIADLVEPDAVTLIGELLEWHAYQKCKALKPLVRHLIEKYVTHLPTRANSEYEARAIDVISAAFQPELKAGHRLTFTPEGVRSVDPNPTN